MTQDFHRIPLSPLRKAIAARMTEAKRSIPHFRLGTDIATGPLLACRAQHNANNPDSAVSINDCFIRATALALAQHPEINIQFVDDEIRCFKHAAIAIVVAVEGGLLTPVIQEADLKSLIQISSEARTLANLARLGKLKMTEILGGSFSISNLGGFGIDRFDAIINPPQCAILAIGRLRPTGLEQLPDQPTASSVTVTLSLDHRVIDGATGAAFLATIKTLVETAEPVFAPL